MALQDLEMPDISKLASICSNLLIGYATSYPVPPASRQSAEWQQDSFSAWEPDLAAFSRSNRSFDYHETHALVMGQLSVLRTNLEFVASRNAEFPGRSDILSFPQEPQRLEWIHQLEGQTSEAFHAIEATISRLEQLREIIRQPPALDHESETEDRTERDTASSDFTSIKRAAQSSSPTASPSLQGHLAPSVLEQHSSLRHPTKQRQEPTHIQQTTIHGVSTPAEPSRSSTEVQSHRKPKCDVCLDTPRPRTSFNPNSIASSPQNSTTTLAADDRDDYPKPPKAEHRQPAPQGSCAKAGVVHRRTMQPDFRPSSSQKSQMVAVDSRQPDLCVGIDFGTTYTGVSWITPKEQRNQTNIITRWPGEVANEDKVPTILAKDASGGETRWGFLCKELAEGGRWRFFKLLLDPDMHNQLLTKNEHELWVPGSIGQLQEIVTLYLRQIYTYLSNEIPKLVKADLTFSRQLRLKTWDSLTIDFIFSTPTTWQAPVSQCFKSIVSKAGFGENKLHKVALGLTEPEAAAVFTYQAERVGKVYKGEVVLSIDAGGGTTDLAFVEATADTADSLTLNEVHPINGVGVGSTGIDREFAKLIEDRIKAHPNALSKLPTGFPLRASQSDDFQTWKHRLGSKDWDQSKSDFLIEVAGLEKSYSNEDLGIRRGRLSFTRQQLESCFDTILKQIKSLIKEALHNFEGVCRLKGISSYVDHIVLSGGLGSSDYVLKELATYFKDLAREPNSCVAGSRVLRTKGNARMVVVEGLLYDRRTEVHALRNHIARANYGIVIEESRSGGPARFPGGPTIHWLVKLGDTIQLGKPVTIDVTKRLEKSDPRRWTEKIVWLRGAGKFLPETVKDGWEVGMEELRSVDIEVRPGAKLSAGGRTWMRTSTYDKFKFELMLVVGPSGDCDVEVSENVIKRSE